MKDKIAATAAVLLIGGTVIAASSHFIGPRGTLTESRHLAAKFKGQSTAPVWVVEYADFQCPSCKNGAGLLNGLFEKHPSQLYIQARYYPLDKHSHGLESAVCAECAAKQGKFWEYAQLLFSKQDLWSNVDNAVLLFRSYAEQLSLDLSRFDTCVKNPDTQKTILEQRKEADGLGVKITPTFFVNGKIVAGVKAMTEEMKRYFPEEAAS